MLFLFVCDLLTVCLASLSTLLHSVVYEKQPQLKTYSKTVRKIRRKNVASEAIQYQQEGPNLLVQLRLRLGKERKKRKNKLQHENTL